MRSVIVVCIVFMSIAGAAFRAEAMLVEDANDKNIPGDCRAVAQVLVQLAKQKSSSSQEQLIQTTRKLLQAKGYQGSFGKIDDIAPFYAGMTTQSAPEVDQFIATATDEQLAEMEEEEEIACVKEALMEINDRPLAEEKGTSTTESPAVKESH